MLQTYQIAHAQHQAQPGYAPLQTINSQLGARPAPIRYLQSLSRAELLKLYLHDDDGCVAPSSPSAFLDGEWNGVLLNNGPVLTRVVTFITNQLFGKGRRWNGKAFDTSTGCGHNRFVRLQSTIQAPRGSKATDSVFVVARTEDDQPFNLLFANRVWGWDRPLSWNMLVSPRPSYSTVRHQGRGGRRGNTWWTKFELCRSIVLALIDDKSSDWEVLLGWGAMGWSGGRLNSSPFCLYRRRQKRRPTK